MRIETQYTAKKVDFIDDIDLRKALEERLLELDNIFSVNANYSTVFMAIGALEGIFKHIAEIYKTEIQSSPTYPKSPKAKKKKFDDLTIDELYNELKVLKIIPDIPQYPHLYDLFRNYRNCIHPQAQVKKGLKINLGQAQIALGLLNDTLQNLDRNIFIGKLIFEKIAGSPSFESGRELNLRLGQTPHNSFLILKNIISQKLGIRFDLDLPLKSIFNFVFNFDNEGDFKMVRLDNRIMDQFPNSVLRSSQKYYWRIFLHAIPQKLPGKEQLKIEIEIDFPSQVFNFIVDNNKYTFQDLKGNPKDLFSEIKPGKQVGFFNELGPVRLSQISFTL